MSSSLFYMGIQAVLKSWTNFQLAVSHSFGGPNTNAKAQWFVGAIEQYFNDNDNLEDFEVESMLNNVMVNEFNVVSEDADDTLLVAKEICRFYSLWKGNKHEILRNKLRQLPMVDLSECQAAEEQPRRAKEEEKILAQMKIEEEPEKEEVTDPDGWQQVKMKKNKKKKKHLVAEDVEMET